MEGEAREEEEEPPVPALAGGVQLGNFLWPGVPGVLAVIRDLLTTGEAGGG